ncbi:hypothetical protein PDG61_16905 [Mycolicibacterium sp. BiH015]|nr:hypothetical protein [Mycolicibacterium sp. BiH015]MDA2892602.1 hypothetical protein [Mycolicibacterium sp. BiH015]
MVVRGSSFAMVMSGITFTVEECLRAIYSQRVPMALLSITREREHH